MSTYLLIILLQCLVAFAILLEVNFPNHAKKSTQAVARLILKSGPVDYLRLAKLIYLADRQSILARGVPIVGGSYFSMPKGPTIGELMDFVHQRNAPQWSETISPRFGNEIRLQGEPRFDALSQSEITILDLVVAQHIQRTTDELVKWCHDNCPEYEKAKRKPIKVESILRAAGKAKEQIQKILQDAQEVQELDQLLA